MGLRERAARMAADADPGVSVHRTQVRRGTRYEAARNGRSLGIATVYTGGDEEGWTIDGLTHESIAGWLAQVFQIGNEDL